MPTVDPPTEEVYLTPEERRTVFSALRRELDDAEDLIARLRLVVENGQAAYAHWVRVGVQAAREDELMRVMGQAMSSLEVLAAADAQRAEAVLIRERRMARLLGKEGLAAAVVTALATAFAAWVAAGSPMP